MQNLKIHLLLGPPSAIKCPPHPEMKTKRGEKMLVVVKHSFQEKWCNYIMQAVNMKFWVGYYLCSVSICNKLVFTGVGYQPPAPPPNWRTREVTLRLASTLRPVQHRWPYQEYKTPANIALGVPETHKPSHRDIRDIIDRLHVLRGDRHEYQPLIRKGASALSLRPLLGRSLHNVHRLGLNRAAALRL